MRTISQELFNMSIFDMSLKIINFILQPHPHGPMGIYVARSWTSIYFWPFDSGTLLYFLRGHYSDLLVFGVDEV